MPFIAPTENLTGRLLIASPVLAETEFAQTVIYVCAHSQESGAMGMIVNRRLTYPGVEELFKQLEVTPNPPKRLFGLGVGGPVEHGRGFVLHTSDWQGEGVVQVSDAISMTASLDILKELAEGKGPRQAVMMLGHASWQAGQLENEILNGNAWFTAPECEELIFGGRSETKWQRALSGLGLQPSALTAAVGEA